MALPTANNRKQRILAVTAGLAATGAVVGALCAAVVVTVIASAEAKRSFAFSPSYFRLLGIVTLLGATTGTVGAPALAWGLLRRVPLGRAILLTALGTITGSILGETFFPLDPSRSVIPGVIVCGWMGFLIAGLVLWIRSRRHA